MQPAPQVLFYCRVGGWPKKQQRSDPEKPFAYSYLLYKKLNNKNRKQLQDIQILDDWDYFLGTINCTSTAVPFFFVSKGEVSIEKPRENSPWEGEDRFLFGIT